MTDFKDPAERFVQELGLVAQNDGMPRISGRMMGLLVIEDGPLSFSELAERLAISRASVSTNTRMLESLGVIERIARPGERQDYFRLAPNPYVSLLKGTLDRTRRARTAVTRALADLPAERAGARGRLEELDRFYASVSESVAQLIAAYAEDA